MASYTALLQVSLCGWGVTSSFCIFLQLEPQHQPWAYSGGLFQESCEQGGDADAGGPGNVLIGEP